MALAHRTIYRNCYYLNSALLPVKWTNVTNNTVRILANGICYQHSSFHRPLFETRHIKFFPSSIQHYSTKEPTTDKPLQENEVPKQGLMQRLKQMYKDYWYVVLPVHMATSCVWFGCFYYAVRSGFDVLGLLQAIGISESIIAPLKDSSMGYVAFALALYKLVTPLRYAVTVGGTTYAIKKLTSLGWLKPMPSRERLKEIYHAQKGNIQDRMAEGKQHYQEKRFQVMEEMKRYKTEMRNMKNKVKEK